MGRKVHVSTGRAKTLHAATMSLLCGLLAVAAGACADDDLRRHSAPIGVEDGDEEDDEEGDDSASADAVEQGSCADGATRECHVTLGQHGSVVTCYRGVQVCTEGAWGPCTDAETPGL